MTTSFPSKPIHVFDAPEISDVSTKFHYNFFVSDERINESGLERLDGSLPAEFRRKGNADYRNLRAKIPRFVIINIGYNDKTRQTDSNVSRGSDMSATKAELTRAVSSGKVVTETNATSRVYNALTLGDAGLDDELENVFRLALNKYIVEGDSPTSTIDSISEVTDLSSETLSSMLPPTLNDSLSLVAHERISQLDGGLRKNSAQVQLNSTYAPMMLRKSVVRGTSLMDGYINSNYLISTDIVNSMPNSPSRLGILPTPGEEDLTFNMPFFRDPIAISGDAEPRAESGVAGLLIEKVRILDGKRYRMPSIIVSGRKPELVIDSKVAYGQTYEYRIRTLSIFRIPVTTQDGTRLLATYLVGSKQSQPFQVIATENRAPNPPSDVNFYYNYEDDNLTILWRKPTNPQRDVKYYQIFRRKSLNEPFELIGMLDFDDSLVRTLPIESVDPALIISSPAPSYKFVDSDFDREGDSIYAVVSIDARHLSSGYSSQVRVVFDTNKNGIKKKLVCRQGAPKQYPNWTKEENFFVDTMKDSSHQKVHIYFDPEAYTVIGKSGTRTPLFLANSHDRLAKYVFQFINTDRLAEQRFEVTIDDTAFVEGDVGYSEPAQGTVQRATLATISSAGSISDAGITLSNIGNLNINR